MNPQMQKETLRAIPSIPATVWAAIKAYALVHDVEAGATLNHIYDLREGSEGEADAIIVWGRDGWRDGYFYAVMSYDGRALVLEHSGHAQAPSLFTVWEHIKEAILGVVE